MKRLLVFMIIAFMLIASVFGASNEPSSWASDSVKRAISAGIVPSYLQRNYQQPISRKDFAELVINTVAAAEGYTPSQLMQKFEVKAPFIDVNSDNVDVAYIMNILNGTTPETFEPFKKINRQEAAVMMSNAMHVIEVNPTGEGLKFTDSDSIAWWAKDSVRRASEAGIFKGYGDGKFHPLDYYTVEQSIITMCNLLDISIPDRTFCIRGDAVINLDKISKFAGNYIAIETQVQEQDLAKILPRLNAKAISELVYNSMGLRIYECSDCGNIHLIVQFMEYPD